jgi:hypothetical protein
MAMARDYSGRAMRCDALSVLARSTHIHMAARPLALARYSSQYPNPPSSHYIIAHYQSQWPLRYILPYPHPISLAC